MAKRKSGIARLRKKISRLTTRGEKKLIRYGKRTRKSTLGFAKREKKSIKRARKQLKKSWKSFQKGLKPEQLGKVYMRDMNLIYQNMLDACFVAATENAGMVADDSPVYLGDYKAAHEVAETGRGAVVFNATPYSEVLEIGARSHFLGKDAEEDVARWAMKKIGLSEGDARRFSYFYSRKLGRGQAKAQLEPQKIYGRNLDRMSQTFEGIMKRAVP